MRREIMEKICTILKTTEFKEGKRFGAFDKGLNCPGGCAIGALYYHAGIHTSRQLYRWVEVHKTTSIAGIKILYPGITYDEARQITKWYDEGALSTLRSFKDIAALIEEHLLTEEPVEVIETERELVHA